MEKYPHRQLASRLSYFVVLCKTKRQAEKALAGSDGVRGG